MKTSKQKNPNYPKQTTCRLCGKQLSNYNYTNHFQNIHGITRDEYFREYHPTLFKYTITVFGKLIEKKLFLSGIKRIKDPSFTSNLSFSEVKFLLYVFSLTNDNKLPSKKMIKIVFDYWMKLDDCSFKEIKERWQSLMTYNGHYTSKEYCFLLNGGEMGYKIWNEKRENFSGEKNAAYNHGGKFSSLSKNFFKYENLNEDEVKSKIDSVSKKISRGNSENKNKPTTLIYWLNQGYSKDKAEELLKERQTTFSLEKCIDRYGEEEGNRIFQERQEKWQNTLMSKSTEEIERINREKLSKGKGYSKISQKLFIELYKYVYDKFDEIYFATLNNKKGIVESVDKNFFYEYCHVSKKSKKQKIFFFDFFIKDTKKIIEFDGDYWHGQARGNQLRDKERDEVLLSEGFQVLRVKERDYKNNPNQTVKECIEWLIS